VPGPGGSAERLQHKPPPWPPQAAQGTPISQPQGSVRDALQLLHPLPPVASNRSCHASHSSSGRLADIGPPVQLVPVQAFPPSIFRVKNRRDIGKSQSKCTDSKMETPRRARRGGQADGVVICTAVASLAAVGIAGAAPPRVMLEAAQLATRGHGCHCVRRLLPHLAGVLLARRARIALGTATQCTRRNDSP
jgi:hypothetical protein